MNFKLNFKKTMLLAMGGLFMASSLSFAQPIRTPEGNMPMVHWAVLESTPGDMQRLKLRRKPVRMRSMALLM